MPFCHYNDYINNVPEENIIDTINARLNIIMQLQERLEKYMSKASTYHLIVSSIRNKDRYYAVNTEKRRRIYLGLDREADIKKLANKYYKEKLLYAAKKEIAVLQRSLKRIAELSNNGIESVYPSLPKTIKKYVTPDSFTDEGFAKLWSEQEFIQAKRTEYHKFKVNERTVVRSKSEFMIANLLEKKGIPYRYEEQLVLDPDMGIIYYPDFTILNKRTRQTIYWEHLGKLGDEDYCSDNIQKLEDYADAGIIQGKNLILTYECASKPLTTKMIELMIKEFLE